MKCQLIQTTKIADNNKAEKEMLGFLRNLPETAFLYREFKLTPAYYEQTKEIEEQRPDFVIVDRQLGLISVEVKDWNLTANTYEWVNQYKIKKVGPGGKEDLLDNPVEQTSRYFHGFKELITSQGGDIYVSSFLAFPRLSRAEFLNKFANINLFQNPQSKFFINMEKTIFKEELDKYFLNPEKLFINLLNKGYRAFNYSAREIEAINRILMPPSFVIGDFSRRQANQQQLRVISDQQQEWIFGIDRQMNYLLDVPGSGKTNALISKAIHAVEQAGGSQPRFLITTYSKNLEINIRRIFEHKIQGLSDSQRYTKAITIQSVPGLLDQVLLALYSPDDIETQHADQTNYEDWSKTNVKEILSLEPDKFRVFDAIFIDEIQDFDNYFLLVLDHFIKGNKNYFFVGDIGQKIYERSYDLERLGIIPHRIELPKSYQMFRTPQYIGKLAVNFIWGDAHCRRDFEQNGYRGNFNYPNKLNYAAEILKAGTPVLDLLQRIQGFLGSTYVADDILIIASAAMLMEIRSSLQQAGIACVIGEPENEGFVALVEFQEAKGLEREIVLVVGIEDLYEHSKPEGLFWDEEKKLIREGLSRRMIYVAITRTIEQLIIYYKNPTNLFISDLLKANEKILANREK